MLQIKYHLGTILHFKKIKGIKCIESGKIVKYCKITIKNMITKKITIRA